MHVHMCAIYTSLQLYLPRTLIKHSLETPPLLVGMKTFIATLEISMAFYQINGDEHNSRAGNTINGHM